MRDNATKKAIRILRNKVNWAASFRKDSFTMDAADALAISDELHRLEALVGEDHTTALTDRMELFLHRAVKTAGTYDPKCLYVVEEEMTSDEFDLAKDFLTWLVKGHKTFGHNLPSVWAEWQKAVV